MSPNARRMQPAPKSPATQDAEDTIVNFSDAALYVAGIQTVFAICTCACVSVLSCWLAPTGGGVSAVRTLAFCSAAGAALMYQPLRFGRAHGVTVVFASLQLAVPLYLITLVVAQLVHTCTSDPSHAPSWRYEQLPQTQPTCTQLHTSGWWHAFRSAPHNPRTRRRCRHNLQLVGPSFTTGSAPM